MHNLCPYQGGPRPGPLRPLPEVPLLEKGPKFGGKKIFFLKKKISLHFFSLLRKSKELSNARDRDKTNLKKNRFYK